MTNNNVRAREIARSHFRRTTDDPLQRGAVPTQRPLARVYILRLVQYVAPLLIWSGFALAGPAPPSQMDVFGWQPPALTSIDTIKFPRRLVRNSSYGRVVAEISLWRDGTTQDIRFTQIDNGDLKRWAIKILRSARFTPGRLDGSPLACRVPVHVLFREASDGEPASYEVWLPSDSASYGRCLLDHFLEINDGLPPIVARAGSYTRSGAPDLALGIVTFEVYVHKDGSREEGHLVYSPDAELTRNALSALVELQVLPPRYRNRGYGCWTRITVGFCRDWDYPTKPVDLTQSPYRGWASPHVVPVINTGEIEPQFMGLLHTADMFSTDLLELASGLVQGHALFCARIDTTGIVAEWFKARDVNVEALKTDYEYLLYTSSRMNEPVPAALVGMNYIDQARLSAQDLQKVLPHLLFSPARDIKGNRVEKWVLVTPAIFR
jgi:hypothetical protein